MKRLFILITLFIANTILAQVKFEANVSKNTLGLNERVRIEFSMNEDGDNFVPPNFEACGFKVVGGPSQSVSETWINGKGSFQKTYSYVLLPLKKGSLVIKQALIEINGQIYKTSPVKIAVTNAVNQPNEPNDPATIRADNNLYLVADISKTNPYVNEPITVVYKLYFSYNIGITNWQELNKPKYKDFWSQNIDIKQLVAEEGMFKGERYRYVVLRKTVLYPQKSGKLVIEPLSLDIDCQVPRGRPNFFGQVQLVDDSKRVSAGSNVINVKPLPEAGKPANFTGAVGKFNFSVLPSKTTLKNGESVDLAINVTGVGNLKLFNLPKPVVSSEIEMYDPEHSENVSTPLSGMTGSISDRYTLIPQSKGNFPIKGLEFSFFDLSSQSYKTITSPNIMLNVLEGPNNSNSTINTEVANSKTVTTSSKSFAYIKQKTALKSIKSNDFLGSGWFYGLLILPFLLIPGIIIFKKRKDTQDADIIGNKTKKANALAKKYLSEAKKQINNKEPFYIALEKAMHNFLKAKLNIETSEMNKDKITEILLLRNANSETVKEFITLSESCELARYAPSTSTIIHQDYEKAVQIISNLEKQIS